MEKIIRNIGITKSERYLAKLADRTFLNLWAYPNVYRSPGEELCDLLVVCGEHIIIFSDKNIKWPDKEAPQAWSRWYRKAIKKGAEQLYGAERSINKWPNKIFLDARCTQALPMTIPSAKTVHLVLVARGAGGACSKFFNGDSGSFLLSPSLHGHDHLDTTSDEFLPFRVGDIDPLCSFIHILNDVTLDIVMRELDTIKDFVAYLSEKARFVRSGNLILAAGEEDLLAYYLTHMISKNEHGFSHPENRPWGTTDRLALDKGHYESMIRNPQYIKKKEADKDSYLWDRLIEAFTNHMLAGTTIVPEGEHFEMGKHTLGVQHMAQEPRVMRRMLSERITGILEKSKLQDRTFGSSLPTAEYPGDGTGYIFLTLALPKKKLEGGYQQYRQARSNMLYTYCLGTLKQFPLLKRIVGIATEPLPSPNTQSGASEDMVFVLQPNEWSLELRNEFEMLRKHYDILREDRVTFQNMGVQEYPD